MRYCPCNNQNYHDCECPDSCGCGCKKNLHSKMSKDEAFEYISKGEVWIKCPEVHSPDTLLDCRCKGRRVVLHPSYIEACHLLGLSSEPPVPDAGQSFLTRDILYHQDNIVMASLMRSKE